MEILHFLASVLAIGVSFVHFCFHRAWSVESNQGGDVFKFSRRQGAHENAHRRAFQLEHAGGVALAQKLISLIVVQGDVFYRQLAAFGASDNLQRVADYVQVAQAQQVHLQQAHILDCAHLELSDDRSIVRIFAAGRFALNRHIVGDRLFGQHDRSRVDAVLAAKPFEAHGGIYDLTGFFVFAVDGAQVARFVKAGLKALFPVKAGMQGGVAPQNQRRDGFGEFVSERIGKSQHSGGISHGLASFDPGEGDYLRHLLATVEVGKISDQVVSVAGVEIYVYVWHLAAAGIQKALKQQVVADRIQIGDAQAIRHRAACRAPPAGADSDVLLFGMAHEIPDDQEVSGKSHVGDDFQFVAETIGYLV